MAKSAGFTHCRVKEMAFPTLPRTIDDAFHVSTHITREKYEALDEEQKANVKAKFIEKWTALYGPETGQIPSINLLYFVMEK